MKVLKNILLLIINPFRTFGLGRTSDKIVKFASNKTYFVYILSFVIAVIIIVINYFL